MRDLPVCPLLGENIKHVAMSQNRETVDIAVLWEPVTKTVHPKHN